jgi:IS30 family transposase
MDKRIEEVYTDPSNPAGYSGFESLFNQVHKKYPTINKKDVKKYLEANRTYTLFKPRRLKYKRSKFVPAGYLVQVHADLGDFQSLSRTNRGHKFLLCVVDVLSRRVFTAPLKSKKSKEVINGFKNVFNQMDYLPQEIFVDLGLEFDNKLFKQFLEEKGVNRLEARSSITKAAVAERMIRTIKSRLYRY